MKRASVAHRATKSVPAPVVSAIAASARRVTRRSCSSTDAAEPGGDKATQPAEQRPKRSAGRASAPPKRPAASDNNKRSYEAKWWAAGCRRVAGVDEAGRGPLAGPVVAAAVVVPSDVHFEGVDDSKVLTEAQREELYDMLTTHPRVSWAVSVMEHTVIDEINILQATLRAMEEAVFALPGGAVDRVLIDGNRMPPKLADRAELIVKGDSKSFAIAAASIVAKVTRDRLMLAHHATWPQYGFAEHKGYGVPAHMGAIHMHGPCPIHRRSFQPVKDLTGWTRDKGAAGKKLCDV